jgi:hypothetical protein
VSALADALNEQLLDLAACLCSQIEEEDLPEPCYCGVVPGDAVAVDYVTMNCGRKNGLAFVRLAQVYPASRVGVVNQTLNNCSAGIGVEAEVGIIRRAPAWGKKGEPPTDAANLAGSNLLVDDMAAILAAIQCCFGNPTDPTKQIDHIVQTYRPTILGGALGGSFVVMWAY